MSGFLTTNPLSLALRALFVALGLMVGLAALLVVVVGVAYLINCEWVIQPLINSLIWVYLWWGA